LQESDVIDVNGAINAALILFELAAQSYTLLRSFQYGWSELNYHSAMNSQKEELEYLGVPRLNFQYISK
jgi:hypothetical protein